MISFETLYGFASGPLAWLAFAVFTGGSIYRIYSLIRLVNRKERFIYTYMTWKHSLRSILHWIIPFGSTNWRLNPVLTIVTFSFHICLLATPVFLMAHVVLWKEGWGLSWWTLPQGAADAMTLIVIFACLFFLMRRVTRREVRYLTSPSDFILLGIVAAPFITGLMAAHQIGAYRVILLLHVLAGELMLAVIPFSRLSHMLYAALTRAYIGSEFGNVRHARDW